MSYDLDTPARAYHLAHISHDFGAVYREADERVPTPHRFFTLPYDRGALVGVGTSRLPLGRHACGEVLWRFFDGLGPFQAPLSVAIERFQAIDGELEAAAARLHQLLYTFTVNDMTTDPDLVQNVDFVSRYSTGLYYRARLQTAAFGLFLVEVFNRLTQSTNHRPPDLSLVDWIGELRAKKASKWIQRLDEQYKKAFKWKRRADHFHSKRRPAYVLWYCLRAVIEMCPWYPTEFYMATWEGAMLPGVQITIDCLLLMAENFYLIKDRYLCKKACTLVLEHSFASLDHKAAASNIWVNILLQHREAVKATSSGETELVKLLQEIQDNLFDYDGLRRHWIDQRDVESQGGERALEAHRNADFTPTSLIKWRHAPHVPTARDSESTASIAATRASTGEMKEEALVKSCLSKRGMALPYKYGIDEYLEEELEEEAQTSLFQMMQKLGRRVSGPPRN